jgi:hypothetical protein
MAPAIARVDAFIADCLAGGCDFDLIQMRALSATHLPFTHLPFLFYATVRA